MRSNGEDGFTLVEVLAALLIFSFAIIGLTRAGTESVRAVSVLKDKSYAGIVADNQLIRARIAPLEVGAKTGEESVSGKAYNWRVETSKTESSGFYRLIVTVSDDKTDQVILTRTAFRTDKTL
jgi:general secretion pathway protein I